MYFESLAKNAQFEKKLFLLNKHLRTDTISTCTRHCVVINFHKLIESRPMQTNVLESARK